MKRLFLLIVLVGGYLGGMQDAHRRIAVLARHVAPDTFGKAIEPNVVAGQTGSYASIIKLEDLEAALRDRKFNPDFSVSTYIPLFRAVESFEKEHSHCYSFTHGFSKGRLSLYKLYEQLHVLRGTPLRNRWVPLRRVADLTDLTVEKYIDQYGTNPFNYEDVHKRNLLSVNLAMPGNFLRRESALRYFAEDHTAFRESAVSFDIIRDYMLDFDSQFLTRANGYFKEFIVSELERIGRMLNSKEGCLLQIMIPKDVVDRYVYLAKPGGYFLNEPIRLGNGQIVLDGYDTNVHAYKKISPYLELSEQRPDFCVRSLSHAQARIIMHKDLYTDTRVALKIHTYISEENKVPYEQEIQKLARFIHEIIASNDEDSIIIQKLIQYGWQVKPRVQRVEQSRTWNSTSRSEKLKMYKADCARLALTENEKISKSDDVLRIVTYNVHFWQDPLELKNNFDSIISALQKINADVIILQEMHKGGSLYLAKETIIAEFKKLGYLYGYESFGYKFLTRDGMPCGEIILSKLPITACTVGAGVKGEYHGYSRIELEIAGKKIAVYGTHPNVSNTEQRIREIKNLLAAVHGDDADYIVLGADWNAVRRSDYSDEVWSMLQRMYKTQLRLDQVPTSELALVEKAGFIDSFTAAGVAKPHWSVWNGTLVDFLFVKAKKGNLPVIGSYVYYSAASDHIPVIIDIAVH